MASETTALQSYLDTYARHQAQLPGVQQDWVNALRGEAINTLERIGLPHAKTERWKYTQLNKLFKQGFEPVIDATPQVAALPELPALTESGVYKVVLTDGVLRRDLSDALPAGVQAVSLAEAFTAMPDLLQQYLGRVGPMDATAFWALNTALMRDGVVLHVPAGTAVDLPIQIVNYNGAEATGRQFHRRNLIVVEAEADVTLIDSHYGAEGSLYFANGVSETVVGANARLRHYIHQGESRSAYHIGNSYVRCAEGATYDNFCCMTGALLARNELNLELNGANITAKINGLYMGRDSQHLDTTSHIDHAHPDSYSEETYKGALEDSARGVFQGKITVRPGAQRTNGYQLNRCLLLSDKAEINSKPELEIYADDVACSHGATTGELDDEALFYLRSRGLPETEARNLLIKSYLEDTLDYITHDEVREGVRGLIDRWLIAGSRA